MKLYYITTLIILTSISLHAQQTVLLKDGKTIKGNIVSQDAEGLSLESEDGKRVSISKKNLLKVIYRQIDESEQERIRKEEEEKLSLKEKQDEEERVKKQEAKRIALEQKRKEFEEKQKEELASLEKAITKKKEKSESSKRLGDPNLSYMTHYQFSQMLSSSDIKLAPANATCNEYARSSDWYWLFGTFPITRPDIEKILPKDSKTVRIKSENSWADVGINVVFGFLGTVTRRTIVVESCGAITKTKLYTEDELKLELEKQKFQLKSDFMKEKEEILLITGEEE
jgi:hypothetical protein